LHILPATALFVKLFQQPDHVPVAQPWNYHLIVKEKVIKGIKAGNAPGSPDSHHPCPYLALKKPVGRGHKFRAVDQRLYLAGNVLNSMWAIRI